MAVVNPQRDALEAVQVGKNWPDNLTKQLIPEKYFRLNDGREIYFLGVNNGAPLRRRPNLHIAVFGLFPPANPLVNPDLLPQCGFGGLITGPDKDGWIWAEGMEIESVVNADVLLRLTGHRHQYRPV